LFLESPLGIPKEKNVSYLLGYLPSSNEFVGLMEEVGISQSVPLLSTTDIPIKRENDTKEPETPTKKQRIEIDLTGEKVPTQRIHSKVIHLLEE